MSARPANIEETPLVSVVIPCRNERDFIEPCLASLLAAPYPADRLEILVIDGMSDDGTRGRLAAYAGSHPGVRVLDNPKRITPSALNIGIANARGDVIMRADAHTIYPSSYIPSLVRWLVKSGADNVGGLWITEAGGSGVVARSIAAILAHPAGVGNAHYRVGIHEPRWVDTVPFGCYRRDVFDRIGVFDEDLIRNQDDELNFRLTRAGGRILLVPDVECRYRARGTLGKLWRTYYQYGYYKPLVARKSGGVSSWRQLVPPGFVALVFAAAVLALVVPRMVGLFAAVIAIYLLAVLGASIGIARRDGLRVGLVSPVAFAMLHFSYGLGYLHGAIAFLLFQRASTRQSARLSRLTR